MDLNIIWFLLVAVLIIGYAILDGFDLGVGVLHLFTKDENEKRINLNAIGPVWDGNEVWLLTGGGALFAAFPDSLRYRVQRFLSRSDAASGCSDIPGGFDGIQGKGRFPQMEEILGLCFWSRKPAPRGIIRRCCGEHSQGNSSRQPGNVYRQFLYAS